MFMIAVDQKAVQPIPCAIDQTQSIGNFKQFVPATDRCIKSIG